MREGILTSPRVNQLSPHAELFYRRLLSVLDDFGRYSANPTLLRAGCYPLKIDSVTDDQIKGYLAECIRAKLLIVYAVPEKGDHLEVIDFGQQIRAAKSKFPEPKSGRKVSAEQLLGECVADAQQQKSNAHLVVSVSEDVSEGESVVAAGKPAAPTNPVWLGYATAYESRYGVPPVRNAKVNGQLKTLLARLGADEAAAVAAFYVRHPSAYYVTRGHSVDCLLADCEKLRTEWATNQTITGNRARQQERTADNPFARMHGQQEALSHGK